MVAGQIAVKPELCFNSSYNNNTCNLCQQKCPCGCIDKHLKIDSDKCNDCGLCLAVCPADAISAGSYPKTVIDRIFSQGPRPLGLTCREQARESSWPCLGFLDVRLVLALAYFAGDYQVTINNLGCDNCREEVDAHLREVVDEVNCILASQNKPAVMFGDGCRRTGPPVMSRREFFGELLNTAVKTVQEVMLPLEGGQPFARQEIFKRYVAFEQGSQPVKQKTFYNLVVSGCNACGKCAKLCPMQALTARDNITCLELYHDPSLCIGCRVCVIQCPQSALGLEWATDLTKTMVKSAPFPRCANCGELYQPIGAQELCLECALKQPNAQLWSNN